MGGSVPPRSRVCPGYFQRHQFLGRHQHPDLLHVVSQHGTELVPDGVDAAEERGRRAAGRVLPPELAGDIVDGRIERPRDEGLEANLLVQPGFGVGHEHLVGLGLGVIRARRRVEVLERLLQHGLAPSAARAHLQRVRQLRGVHLVEEASLEQSDEACKHRPELGEDLEVAGRDLTTDIQHNLVRQPEQPLRRHLRVRVNLLDVPCNPLRALPKARAVLEGLAQDARHFVVANETARSARCPRCERAPVDVGVAEHTRNLLREIVVALRDQQISQDRVRIQSNDARHFPHQETFLRHRFPRAKAHCAARLLRHNAGMPQVFSR